MLDQIENFCIGYFLCEFDPGSTKRLTRDLVREILLPHYSKERVAEFIDERLGRFQQVLVDEFNSRFTEGRPVRFQIADSAGTGTLVAGFGNSRSDKPIRFQEVLHKTTPSEFERLAAVVLKAIGCTQIFSTPQSHDQGIDAFGYLTLIDPTPYGVMHRLTWIAQAKHYRSTKLATTDVRDLIGAKDLLVARVFSTVGERYRELELRPIAPIALALVTTEEIPATVRRLADRAGVFVFASSDLFHLIGPMLKRVSLSSLRSLIKREGKSIPTLW